MSNPILEAIENVQKSFSELKETNDKVLAEEAAGNIARANELRESLDKISDELSKHQKERQIVEKRQATLTERLEIVEALSERPGKTVQDKIRNEHKDLMVAWLRSGGNDQQAYARCEELSRKAVEVKDVLVATGLQGGFGVPEEIAAAMDKLLLKQSAILSNVKNVTVGTPDYKELISINGLTYDWAGESSSRTAKNTPTLRECAITHGELYSYVTASNFSLRDVRFNVEGWLVENAVEGFRKGLDASIFNGNGSNRPTGMTATAPTSSDDYASPMRAQAAYQYVAINTDSSSPSIASGVTGDQLINLVYKLNPAYRDGAKFAASTITQGHIRKLKGSDNNYIWQPGLAAGQPDRLLGYEVFTWEDLGSPTVADALPVAFGNFSKAYTLALISGMEIIRDNVSVPGFTKFYLSRRFGGIPTNVDAVKFAKVSLS
jgi:HK97 family phage major capsid protein